MTTVDFNRLRVAIVDRGAHTIGLIKARCSELGITRIEMFRKPNDAVDYYKENQVDLFLIDFLHSAEEAFSLTASLRDPAIIRQDPARVIGIIGEKSRLSVDPPVAAGVDDMLVKPVKAENLRRMIQSVMTKPDDYVYLNSYVGPDRRRLPDNSEFGHGNRREDEQVF